LAASAEPDRPCPAGSPVARVAYTLAQAGQLLGGRSLKTMKRRRDLGLVPVMRFGPDELVPGEWVHQFGKWPREETL